MRHTCKVCNRKRDEKYMLKVPYELTTYLRINKNTWLCRRKTKLKDEIEAPNKCLEHFIYTNINKANYLLEILLYWSKRNQKYIEIEVKKNYWCDGIIKED